MKWFSPTGSVTPFCTICELIYGLYSPQCYFRCMNPLPYPAPVVSQPQTGIRRYDIICAYCQFINGVGSPKCDRVCHGRRPTENSGTSFCEFCQFIYVPNSNQCARTCPVIGSSTSNVNDPICASCQQEHGVGSSLCDAVCVLNAFSIANSNYIASMTVGNSADYLRKPVKRLGVYWKKKTCSIKLNVVLRTFNSASFQILLVVVHILKCLLCIFVYSKVHFEVKLSFSKEKTICLLILGM